MSHQRSNIATSLNKKRHLSLAKKIGAYSIFILFFISICILGLTKQQVRIKDISISGNSSVPTDDILNFIDTELDKTYVWIIPTDNILLLRRGQIKNQILENLKKISAVKIKIHGINKIEVVVKERESKNLWCKGVPSEMGDCYFMDQDGFIFQEAPAFSEGTISEYFGLVVEENPIGQIYFKDNFKNISNLYNTFKKISFTPRYFYAVDVHEYEIYLLYGGKILINDKKPFVSSLVNLQALVDDNYIKNDIESLKKIKYIDLRFGNKVNFELLK